MKPFDIKTANIDELEKAELSCFRDREQVQQVVSQCNQAINMIENRLSELRQQPALDDQQEVVEK